MAGVDEARPRAIHRHRRLRVVAIAFFCLAVIAAVLTLVIAGITRNANVGLAGLVGGFIIAGAVLWARSAGRRDLRGVDDE